MCSARSMQARISLSFLMPESIVSQAPPSDISSYLVILPFSLFDLLYFCFQEDK